MQYVCAKQWGGPIGGGLNEGWSSVVSRLMVDLMPDASSLPDGSLCLHGSQSPISLQDA